MAFDTGIVNDSCYTIYDIKLVDGNKLLKVSERSAASFEEDENTRDESREMATDGYIHFKTNQLNLIRTFFARRSFEILRANTTSGKATGATRVAAGPRG